MTLCSLPDALDNPLSVEERLAAHEATRGDRSTFDALLAKGFSAEEARRIIAESDAAGPRVHIAATLYQPGDDEIVVTKTAEENARDAAWETITKRCKVDPIAYARKVENYKSRLWKLLWALYEVKPDELFHMSDPASLNSAMADTAYSRRRALQILRDPLSGTSTYGQQIGGPIEDALSTPLMRITPPRGFEKSLVDELDDLKTLRTSLPGTRAELGGIGGKVVEDAIKTILQTWGYGPDGPSWHRDIESFETNLDEMLSKNNHAYALQQLAFLGLHVTTGKKPAPSDFQNAKLDRWRAYLGGTWQIQRPVRWTKVAPPSHLTTFAPPRAYALSNDGSPNIAKLATDLFRLIEKAVVVGWDITPHSMFCKWEDVEPFFYPGEILYEKRYDVRQESDEARDLYLALMGTMLTSSIVWLYRNSVDRHGSPLWRRFQSESSSTNWLMTAEMVRARSGPLFSDVFAIEDPNSYDDDDGPRTAYVQLAQHLTDLLTLAVLTKGATRQAIDAAEQMIARLGAAAGS